MSKNKSRIGEKVLGIMQQNPGSRLLERDSQIINTYIDGTTVIGLIQAKQGKYVLPGSQCEIPVIRKNIANKQKKRERKPSH